MKANKIWLKNQKFKHWFRCCVECLCLRSFRKSYIIFDDIYLGGVWFWTLGSKYNSIFHDTELWVQCIRCSLLMWIVRTKFVEEPREIGSGCCVSGNGGETGADAIFFGTSLSWRLTDLFFNIDQVSNKRKGQNEQTRRQSRFGLLSGRPVAS